MKRHSHRRPDVTLGLCAFTHDSSAALLVDGELRGFVEEERLSGEKHTRRFPRLAVDWLLNEHGLGPADVSAVAYNLQPLGFIEAASRSLLQMRYRDALPRLAPRCRSLLHIAGNTHRRLQLLQARFADASVRPIRHHDAHAVYAHLASGHPDPAVLVIDSLGESATTTLTLHHTGRVDRLLTIHDPHSLGYAYGAVTEHLGYRRGDEEGTVMALAALGDPSRFGRLLRDAIHLQPTGFTLDPALFPVRVLDRRYPRLSATFIEQTCPPRHPDQPVEQVHADLAAALQERLEEVMLHLALLAHRLTRRKHLCLAGGVAMNCVAVGKILATGAFEDVFVPPAPGDSGTAIGAAAALFWQTTGRSPTGIARRCYLGPSYTASTAWAAAHNVGLHVQELQDPVGTTADCLATGRVVGLFQSAVEAGPRALGNRSILASPLDPSVIDTLNRRVKFREPFRPFAPVVLADDVRSWFHLDQPSPYMAIAVPATDRTKRELPAIVHTNGLTRVQTVTAADNPLLASILDAFAARTGVPLLINTSLNVKGQPICGTPDMAARCLAESGLDALLMEGLWITRGRE